ncbi:hypothetical protein [bacterium endosymbiont of Bathymodiolus sp. 5 South]|uniref:hypothetical protein n=1 Tax=bacterium endosymbiont of Bathymodiolus sp. 5 South TaxID=1181670 RepID=UPI001118A96A|nr:hypothetical protein [bacterium endosymbiont of Bathymodiolus sp. 5 South]
MSMVIVGFIVINQFVVWFLRVDYLCKGLTTIKFQNLILEAVNTKVDSRPENNPEIIRSKD